MSPQCAGCGGNSDRREFLRQVTVILAGLPIAFAPGRLTGADEAA
jgi:hypothetical protein